MSIYIQNRKAGFNYELLDKFEAGISLLGTEVKSVRKGQGKLDGAYVVVRDGQAYLVGASIPPFQVANAREDYDPERLRTLLLSKKELAKLEQGSEKEGLTIVPLKLYNHGRLIKLEIALARGKKQFDKRETIKARTVKRDLRREHKYQ